MSSDSLLVYKKKSDKIKKTADLVANMIHFLSQDNPDLKKAVRCIKNWEGPTGKKCKKPCLLIEADKIDMVQDVFGFDLDATGKSEESPAT